MLIVYFAQHLITGQNGLAARTQIERDIAAGEARLAQLVAAQDVLEQEIALIDGPHIHADFLEERVRATFGHTAQGEVVIMKRDLILPIIPSDTTEAGIAAGNTGG